jgi:hypothetical protein
MTALRYNILVCCGVAGLSLIAPAAEKVDPLDDRDGRVSLSRQCLGHRVAGEDPTRHNPRRLAFGRHFRGA